MIHTELYDQIPTMRLVLYSKRIPSVNEMYDYRGSNKGVRVFKSAAAYNFQTEIGDQIMKGVDLQKYPWLNNTNRFITDYKFVITRNYDDRDATNMVKICEDGIHNVIGVNDNRVVKSSCMKYTNPELLAEIIVFTIQPYVGSLSIFDVDESEFKNLIESKSEDLSKYYDSKIAKLLESLGKSLIPNKVLDLGFITHSQLTSTIDVPDLDMLLSALKFSNIKLTVVLPKRGSEWVKMISPDGTVCEMYDHEIEDRFNEGYVFGDYNYLYTSL